MKFTGLSGVSIVSLLVLGAAAGDLGGVIQPEFQMGVLPRQQQGNLLHSNLQPFSGALGGAASPGSIVAMRECGLLMNYQITKSTNPKRPFEVEGDTFPDFKTAADRACDNQKNACAQEANNKTGNFEVSDCDKQNEECKEVANSASATAFAAFTTSTAEFDIFCDESVQ